MKHTRLPALGAALVLALALAVSGCGSSNSGQDLTKLSTKQLLAKATAVIKKEHYVSISGKVDNSGTGTGLDLHYVGKDSYGTITLDGADLQLESIAGKTWFKPSDAFWKDQAGSQAGSIIKLINGRWILADPGNTKFAQLIQLASREFIDTEVLDAGKTVTRGASTTVDGVKCLALKSGAGTLYVDADTAHPVQIAGNGSSGSGKADFSYEKVSAPTAPAQDEQVDLSQLGG